MDKTAIDVAGTPIVERVRAAAEAWCGRVVVIGREVGGGPAAAVTEAMGGDLAAADVIVVLAGDLPLLRAEHVASLLDALDEPPPVDAAAALDSRGLPNPLVAAYRTEALRRVVTDLGDGDRADRLLPAGARAVPLDGDATFSVNTPADLEEARRRLSR